MLSLFDLVDICGSTRLGTCLRALPEVLASSLFSQDKGKAAPVQQGKGEMKGKGEEKGPSGPECNERTMWQKRRVELVALSGETVLVSASEGPRGGRSAVYRGMANGGPLERCEKGLPEWFEGNVDTHCLAASGARAAFGAEDGRVFVSEDAGSTWSEAATGLPPVRCVVIESG